MVKVKIDYLGDLKCEVEHVASGQKFNTEAPVDNHGKGDQISPTDMLAAAVGSCIATIMGLKAQSMNIDITGLSIIVTKKMQQTPYRRVKKLDLQIKFPIQLTEKEFAIFSNIIKTCPVTRSLHPDIEVVPHYIMFE